MALDSGITRIKSHHRIQNQSSKTQSMISPVRQQQRHTHQKARAISKLQVRPLRATRAAIIQKTSRQPYHRHG